MVEPACPVCILVLGWHKKWVFHFVLYLFIYGSLTKNKSSGEPTTKKDYFLKIQYKILHLSTFKLKTLFTTTTLFSANNKKRPSAAMVREQERERASSLGVVARGPGVRVLPAPGLCLPHAVLAGSRWPSRSWFTVKGEQDKRFSARLQGLPRASLEALVGRGIEINQ